MSPLAYKPQTWQALCGCHLWWIFIEFEFDEAAALAELWGGVRLGVGCTLVAVMYCGHIPSLFYGQLYRADNTPHEQHTKP